jgi:hypothetical protein
MTEIAGNPSKIANRHLIGALIPHWICHTTNEGPVLGCGREIIASVL